MQFRYPQFVPTPLSQLIPNASAEGVALMQDLMLYDPQQRPTVSQSLQYPFFQANNAIPAPLSTAEPTASTFTRRPVQKSEMEMKLEERAMAKQVRETLFLFITWLNLITLSFQDLIHIAVYFMFCFSAILTYSFSTYYRCKRS